MLPSPLISVIIPTYNRKQIVVEAIESVLKQEPKNYEIIVVDDGSTDGAVSYLQSLNLPIQIISKQNDGVASSRNAGIQAAQGEYIAFLDSDDLWLPEKLRIQLNYFKTHSGIHAVFTDEYISSNGAIEAKTRFERNTPIARPLYPAFVEHTSIHISSVMIKKFLFDEVGLFNESLRIHEDSELWNRIGEKYSFGYIEQPLVVYRWKADPGHLMSEKNRTLFVKQGKKYLQIYRDRRSHRTLTNEERKTLEQSDQILLEYEHNHR